MTLVTPPGMCAIMASQVAGARWRQRRPARVWQVTGVLLTVLVLGIAALYDLQKTKDALELVFSVCILIVTLEDPPHQDDERSRATG